MRNYIQIVSLLLVSFLIQISGFAQCSICTKTASQLGEDAARGLNGGILYLVAAPFLIVGYIGYKWWQSNRQD
ncbi:MAG TPA: hypothetical protein VK628_09750 [Flavitalea sp.]|nr:hypothetical protein [Flavitalea sp.]